VTADIRRLGGREVFANRWLRLRNDEIEYADGTRSTYTVLERSDFALVLPFADGGFWLVEQYRYPLGRRCWELPQGGWPPGGGGSALELAQAELVEETGLRAASWQHLGRLAASPGLGSQYFDVYLAEELTAGDPQREASEADMVHRWFPDPELRAMIRRGEVVDAHTVAALMLYDLRPAVPR
jgi:8-oxo-dGTP pyrophosphatase MutT (NUDIX family)